MPNVDGKKFPYTKEGMKDAKEAANKKEKGSDSKTQGMIRKTISEGAAEMKREVQKRALLKKLRSKKGY
jgi:hypothetical protein